MALTDKQWKAKLAKVKDWEGVKKQADEQGGSVPDGRYRAKVNTAELTESQSSGREQINLFSEITEEGDYAGQNIGCFLGLDEEKSLPWTIAALRRCGYKIVEPEDVVDAVKSLNDDQPEVIIRVKNGFGNLEGSFEKVGEDDDEQPEAVGEVEEPVEEEEVQEEEVVEEAAEEEAAVEIGSDVSFDWKGETLEGKVKEINEAEGKLKISSGGKVYPVKAENVTLLVAEIAAEEEVEEDVQEDPEEEPVEEEKPAKKKVSKPVTKKPAPKPAAKKVVKKK